MKSFAKTSPIVFLPCILPLLVLTHPTLAQAQFNYTTTNGTITITGYPGPPGAVAIPARISGLPVTSIGAYAFYRSWVTDITIPNSTTNICSSAFSECDLLTNILIGTNVASLGDNAFSNCTHLTSITIPDSVTRVGVNAFNGCTGLTNVAIGNGVTSIGERGFFLCSSLASVTMGRNLTSIGQEAFAECYSLANVTIPSGVSNIGSEAFTRCFNLTSVTIPDSVSSIRMGTFYNCYNLLSITIPSSVTDIGDSAFSVCMRLTSVYFQGAAPTFGVDVFDIFTGGDMPGYYWDPVTIYHPPGKMGWSTDLFLPVTTNGGGPSFATVPTKLWLPRVQISDASFDLRNNQFGFNIKGGSGMTVVVEDCTNLASPVWSALQTHTLTTASFYVSDPQWTNYPRHFYRIRSQ